MMGVLPNSSKGRGVCYHVYMIGAHKRTCVDFGTCPTTILLSTITMCECVCVNGSTEGDCKEDLCRMRLVDLYAPQGVDLGEGGSFSYWFDTVK